MKLKVIKLDGSAGGTVEFPDEVFSAPINETLLWEAVEAYRANMRQGTAKTKSRGEVEGSSRKLFPQKHLGRARMGAARSPVRVHGAVAHGPRPRSYRKGLPAKMRHRALLEALKQKLQTGNVVVMEDIKLEDPKTKFVTQALTPVRDSSKVSLLLVPAQYSPELLRASRNIASLDLMPEADLNAYAVWRRQKLVLFKSACKPLVERYR
jgi:large subunit ribosomal protein L4